jgi:hypothetical protein
MILPIRRNGRNLGEFNQDEIARLLSKNSLRPTDEVRMASGQWVSLEDYTQELVALSGPDTHQKQDDSLRPRVHGGQFAKFLDDIKVFGYVLLFILGCLMVIWLVGILVVIFNR